MSAAYQHTPFIVAIDGPAGSGKTTTARELARRLDFVYVDTGAMYRAVALAVRRAGLDGKDVAAVCALVGTLDIRLELAGGLQRTLLADADVEGEIRTPEMSEAASVISAIPCVRSAMVELQRHAAERTAAAILEGRDIGTVVFPDAPCKIFLVADVRTRAERRKLQLEALGTAVDLGALVEEIRRRDHNDANRDHSPLRKADDAIEVETTNTTIDEQVDMIFTVVKKRYDRFRKVAA